jgi:hypothetical protein
MKENIQEAAMLREGEKTSVRLGLYHNERRTHDTEENLLES